MTTHAPTHHHGGLGGAALVVFTLLSWASVPLFLKHFAHLHLDPYSQNGWRYGISAAFWLPVLLVARRRGLIPRSLYRAALVPTAFNIAGQTTFAWGATLLDPGFFSFVFRVQIVFVTLGAYMLFPSERATLRSARFWTGLLLVVAGSVGLIAFKGGAPSGESSVLGIVVSVVSGALFAGYGLSVRYFVSGYPPVLGFGVICNYTALLAIPIMLVMGARAGALVFDFTLVQWLLLAASAFIGIAISHVSYYASIRRLGVSVSLGIIQLQPIVTAAGSWLLYDERLRPAQWACGVVGLVGAVLMLMATGTGAKRSAET